MKTLPLATLAVLLLAAPAHAADATAFLKAFGPKAPTPMDVASANPPPPGMTITMTGTPTGFSLDTSRDGVAMKQALALKPQSGALVEADWSTSATGAPPMPPFKCQGAVTSPTVLELKCWPEGFYADRETNPNFIVLTMNATPKGPRLDLKAPNGAVTTFTARASVAAAAPGAEGVNPLAARMQGGFRYLAGLGTGDTQGALPGDSTAAGKEIMSLVRMKELRGLDFRIERDLVSLGVLDREDEATAWQFRSAGADPMNPQGLAWSAVQSEPRKPASPPVNLVCVGAAAGQGMKVTCWRPDIMKLLGRDPNNAAVGFDFQPWPMWKLSITPGTDNLFTTKVANDQKTPGP